MDYRKSNWHVLQINRLFGWKNKIILAKKAVKEKDSLRKKRLNSRIAYAGGTQNRLS